MPIPFQCHQCGSQFAAPDQLAGKQARCQKCGAVVNVPAARLAASLPSDPLGALPADPFAAGARTLQPAAAPSGGNIPWVPIIVGGGMIAFVGVGFLVLVAVVRMMWPSDPPGRPQVAAIPRVRTPRQPAVNWPPKPTQPAPPVNPAPPAPTATGSASPSGKSETPAGNATTSSGTPGLPNVPAAANRPRGPQPEAPPAEPPPVSSWVAKPDPPQSPVEYKKGKIAIPLPSNAELRLPHGPSHFILGYARDFRNEIWEVIDLRSGKGIGKPLKAKLEFNHNTETFSPDGRYLAAVQHRMGEETPIAIWSFITGDIAQVLKLNSWRIAPLRFGAPHQLVTLHEVDSKLSVLTLWNLQTGQKIREVPFPASKGDERLLTDSLAVSPGGRFAAVMLGKQLGVVDLTTGEPAGAATLPVLPSSCEGAAFSPDGAELAILVSAGSGHRLFIVDFASGRIQVDHDYRGRLQHYFYDGPVLDWLPDKSGLVYEGHVLLERKTGEEVWYFPSTDGNPRRFIRDGEILVLLRNRSDKVLQTLELPDKEISKAMQAIRDGGAAVDSILPPLTTPDLFSVASQALPSGSTPWSLTPDAVGPTPRGQDRDVLIAKSGESVRRAMFAGPAVGKVVVQKEVTPPAGPGRRPQRQVVIERYDMVSGQRGDSLPVPHVYQLADVSPSGRMAVVAFAPEGNKYDRLDILGFAPKKHIAAWRPYGGEPPQQVATAGESRSRFHSLWGLPSDPRSIAWVSLLDDEHLLTLNTTGKLICWKLPECKAVYSFADFGEPMAVSAGRKYIAGGHFGEFRVFEAATGRCVGDLASPLLGSRAIRGAFRPDGKELVAVIDALTDKMLVRWDLTTGKLTQEIPLPAVSVSNFVPFFSGFNGTRLGLEYRGDQHLMIDDQFLFDLDKRALVWRYHLPLGHYAANSPDERSWYLVRKNSAVDQSLFLTSFDTPSANVLEKSANESLERQLVLYPGLSVRVMVDLSAAGMEELLPTIEKAVAQGLESRGLKVDPAAPLTFSVVAAQRSTGEEIAVYSGRSPFHSPFFRSYDQPKETVAQEEMVCRLAVSDSTGKVLWFMDRAARMRDFGSVRSDNAGQELRDEMVKRFESVLAGSGSATQSLPRYIFADLNTILAGQSQLGFRQESPPPQVELPASDKQPPGIAPGS